MTIATTPPPIAGEVIDPPPKETPDKVKQIDEREGAVGTGVGVGYRAYARFSHSQATLLAGGTTYYMFLAMFSILAFGYGLAAAFGADQIAEYLTEAIGEAFPGLLGEEGIDPEQLKSVGQTTSIVGLVGLLYGGGGAVIAAMRSIHLIYGAPKDPRNYVVARLRALVWLAAIGPLILVSFVASSVTTNVSNQFLETLDITWTGPGILLNISTALLTLGVNFLIVYLLLGNFGGIRPPRQSRLIGAAVGAVVIELLKTAMTLILGFAIDKPEYGALAAPIGILFVLYLQAMALYGCAALTAGITDRETPLEVLDVDSVEDAQDAIENASDEVEVTSGEGTAGSDAEPA